MAARDWLIILGPHRSGTSTVAGCLQVAGLDLGDELMPAHADNPKGFFEDLRIVHFHDRLLAQLGSAWMDPFPVLPAAGPVREEGVAEMRRLAAALGVPGRWFCVKDPRMPFFLPWWLEALAAEGVQAHGLVTLRHPLATAGSLVKRDGLPAALAQRLWAAPYAQILGQAGRLPLAMIEYEAMLEDPVAVLGRVLRESGAPLQIAPCAHAVRAFVDRGLDHGRGSGRDAALAAEPGLALVWTSLLQLAAGHAGGILDPARTAPAVAALSALLGDATSVLLRQLGAEAFAANPVQLYFADARQPFAEERSQIIELRGPGWHPLRFKLPEGDWRRLRLDPIDGLGAVRLRRLQVLDGSGADLLASAGDPVLRSCGLARRCGDGGFEVVSTEDDCRLLLPAKGSLAAAVRTVACELRSERFATGEKPFKPGALRRLLNRAGGI